MRDIIISFDNLFTYDLTQSKLLILTKISA